MAAASLQATVVIALAVLGCASAEDGYAFAGCKSNFLEVLQRCSPNHSTPQQCCEDFFLSADRFCLCNKAVTDKYPSAVEYFVAMQARCTAMGHWAQFELGAEARPFPCNDPAFTPAWNGAWDDDAESDSDYSDEELGITADTMKAIWGSLVDSDYDEEDDFGADDDDNVYDDWMRYKVLNDDDIAFAEMSVDGGSDDDLEVDYAMDDEDHFPPTTLLGLRTDFVAAADEEDDDDYYYMDTYGYESFEEDDVFGGHNLPTTVHPEDDTAFLSHEEVITTEVTKTLNFAISCDGDDEECEHLLQSHLAYEGAMDRMDMDDDSLRPLGESFSHLVTDLTPDLGMGEMMFELQEWIATLAKSMSGMLDPLSQSSGMVVDELDMELVFEEQVLQERTPRELHLSGADMDLDIDIDIEIEIEDHKNASDDFAAGNMVHELDLDISLNIEVEDMSPEDMKKIPGKIADALRKMNIPLDAGAIAAQLEPQLQLQRTSNIKEMEIEIQYEQAETMEGEEEEDDTISDASRVSDGDAPIFWQFQSTELQSPGAQGDNENSPPVVLKPIHGATAPLTPNSDSAVRVEVNPDRHDEVFVTIEADEDEDVVLTLENDSDDKVILSIDDDLLNKHATVALDAGSSAFIVSQDDSKQNFNVRVLPYVSSDADVEEPMRTDSIQAYSLEVTSGYEIRVEQWGSAAAQPSREDVDIVIDMTHETDVQQVAGDASDLVTIEVELTMDASEDLDITVDVTEHMQATQGADTDSEGNPYLIIERLQQYIFRLECVFVLVYATVCLALMAIFYYLYQLCIASAAGQTSRPDEEDVEEAAAFSVNPAFIADAQAKINVIFASDYIDNEDGYYVPLAEEEAAGEAK